jgi:hypothetical protein
VELWVFAGQGTHLVSHDREATPGLTGTRSFDRGVKRQQVGLLGNAVNHRQPPLQFVRFAAPGAQ